MAKPLRSIGKMQTWEPPDKSFSKHTITDGEGEEQPNEGSVCIIGITLLEGIELDPVDLGNYVIAPRHEITVGEGDSPLADLFDKVLTSMKNGEACYVKTKVDAKGNKVDDVIGKGKVLKFNMFLESFQRSADLVDLEGDERLEKAQHHKNKGTELFRNDNLSYAIKRYERALDYLGGKAQSKRLPGELPLQHKTLVLQCHLNIAAAFLKQEKYEGVVEHCTQALDVDSSAIKGLFRRGQAYVKLHKMKEAHDDFSAVLEIESNNEAARNQLKAVENVILKEKQMYQKMFS